MTPAKPSRTQVRIGPVLLPMAVAFPLIVSLVMTLFVSGVSTGRALGGAVVFHQPARWVATWLAAYTFSWPIVFPTLLVVNPLVGRALSKFVVPNPSTLTHPPHRRDLDAGAPDGWGPPDYIHPFEEMVRLLEDPARAVWQRPDALLALMGSVDGLDVYDLGAGTGWFAAQLALSGARVVAADPDRRFLAYSLARRELLGVSPEQFIVRPIPLDDPKLDEGEVDWLVCMNAWHQVPHRTEYLGKIMRGLRPSGRILLVNHHGSETPYGPPAAFRVSIEQTLAELRSARFRISAIDADFSPTHYVVIAERP